MRTHLIALLPALALAGALSSGARADEVTHLPAARVADAFTRGEVLVKDDGFEIHASRRDAPGRGEVHETDTDVIHVLSGTATFVTGGSLVDPEAIAPGEIRGTSIRGGQERVLREGDVIVVPAGVPHWFMTVDAPVTYHVVKVR